MTFLGLLCLPFVLGFTGQVVGVVDVDTIAVMHYNKPERIRLHGIDCQGDGKRAKQATSDLIFGKSVAVRGYGKDRHGRTVAAIILPDVNNVLVKDGWCWWYRRCGRRYRLSPCRG